MFLIGHREHFSKDKLEYLENEVNLILQTDNLSNLENRRLLFTSPGLCKITGICSRNKCPGNVMNDIISRTFTPLQPGSPLNSKKKIPKTNVFMFSHNNRLHPCLANSVTISWNREGYSLPDDREPFSRQYQRPEIMDFFQKIRRIVNR